MLTRQKLQSHKEWIEFESAFLGFIYDEELSMSCIWKESLTKLQIAPHISEPSESNQL